MEVDNQVPDSEGTADPPSSLEEMRKRRLAYFSTTEKSNPTLSKGSGKETSQAQMSDSAINSLLLHTDNSGNPKHSHNKALPSQPLDRTESGTSENSHVNLMANKDQNISVGRQILHTSGEPQASSHYVTRQKNYPEVSMLPRNNHPVHGLYRLSLGESQDFGSAFVSHADVDYRDLGLSTHRPDSQVDGGTKSIEGEVFIPNPQGPGKLVRGIFSEKTIEEMQSALGEKGMEELVLKVNREWQLHRETSVSRHRDETGVCDSPRVGEPKSHGERLSRSSSVDSSDGKQKPYPEQSTQRKISRPRSQSPGRMGNTITKNLQQLKEGEKEVFTLVRNYDQVTVPKTTRNSFSADEIYRQAFGGPPELSSSFDRQQFGHMHHPGSWTQSNTWQDKLHNPSSSENRFSSPRRRPSHDNGMNNFSNTPPYMNHQNPYSFPPPAYPPPPFESHPNNSVPMSPHSAGLPSSPYASQEGAFPFNRQPPFRSISNHQSSHYPDPNHSYAYHSSYMPPSPSSVNPPSPSPYFYPPPPFPGAYGVPRFPNGVPLHLPPPSIPPPQLMKQHSLNTPHPLQPHPPPPNSARRNSATQLGGLNSQPTTDALTNGGHIKAPHPPPVPPALRAKDEPHEYAHHGMEHRKISSGGVHPGTQPGGEEVNSYNLQRYFSSLELYNRSTPDPVPELLLHCSHSIEGDLGRSNNDDAASTFTGVSGTSVGKAGGVTRRLQDLGVDLDHLKHLRVVDKKYDQEAAYAEFENLVKGVRYCPECNSKNKAYMNWCIECGEMLIGVELSFPGNKSRPGSEEEKRRKMKTNRGRNSARSVEKRSERGRLSVAEAGCGDSHKESSPESGRGLSLSSSPVRYRREQEDAGEPKDSGRASSGDVRERGMNLHQGEDDEEENVESEENGEEVDNADSEYMHEDTELDVFEQIKDPVLREFIISYKNRQSSNQVNNVDQGVDNIPENSDAEYVMSQYDTSSSPVEEGFVPTRKDESKQATHHAVPVSQFTHAHSEADQTKSKYSKSFPKQSQSPHYGNSGADKKIDDEQMAGYSGANASVAEPSEPQSKELGKKKKKKKKKRGEAMDIEIFGYEETRLSRNSSRASNLNVVPALNLKCSSDEDSDDDDDSEEDDESDDDENDSGEAVVPSVPEKNLSASKYQSNVKNQYPGEHQGAYTKQEHVNGRNAPQKTPTTTQKSPPQRPVSQPSASRTSQRGHGSASVPANYQRHWARSSIAWSSYNPRELSTRSSLDQAPGRGTGRPKSALASRSSYSLTDGAGGRGVGNTGIPVKQRPSSADYSNRRSFTETRPRPSSAKVTSSREGLLSQAASETSRNVPPSQARQNCYSAPYGGQRGVSSAGRTRTSLLRTSVNVQGDSATTAAPSLQPTSTSGGEVGKEDDSPRLLCAELHRLPHTQEEEVYADKLHAVAKNAYDKFQEMTPRIAEGEVSRWQCMPDEIWLYIFNFLSQADLKRLMLACQYFYRLANDETLWKYITVKPRCAMTDVALATIANHRPLSLAMVKCQGNNVTVDGLHYFFKETQDKLRELNICGCSQGSLVGSVMLSVAAQYCRQLTHLDASFCSVSDESFVAISECADRLESVCVNGFQSMNDASLLTLLKKHGKSLHTLELYACFSLNASVFRSLGEHCTSLKRLCLGSCNKLTDSAMITLSTHLARIEELDLRGCKNLRNDCIRKIVRNCPRIHTLVLANCQQISDIALTEIATYLKTTLRVLDVCGCNRVSDQGVINLAKNCDRLSTLDISSTRCTSTSVNQLAGNNCSRWLETVKLSFLSGLSEACMLHLIRQCHRLKLIHVFGCSSLKNLAKLRALNPKLCVEGDVEVPRLTYSLSLG